MVRTHNRGAHVEAQARTRAGPPPEAGSAGPGGPGLGESGRVTDESGKHGWVGFARALRGPGWLPRPVATALLLIGLALGWASPEPSAERHRAGLPARLGERPVRRGGRADHRRSGSGGRGAARRLPAGRGAADLTLAMGRHHPAGRHGAGQLPRGRRPRPGRRAVGIRRLLRAAPGGLGLEGGVDPVRHRSRAAARAAPRRGRSRCRSGPSCSTRREPRSRRSPWSTPSGSSPAAWRTRPGPRAAWPASTGLAASQILSWISEAPSAKFLELVRFSPAGYHRLRARLARVPGLTHQAAAAAAVRQHRPGRVRRGRQRGGQGTAGRRDPVPAGHDGRPDRAAAGVPAPARRHAHHRGRHRERRRPGGLGAARSAGQPGTDVQTTINASVQHAADSALDSLGAPAAIVAIAPATGHVLAVAQHTPAA